MKESQDHEHDAIREMRAHFLVPPASEELFAGLDTLVPALPGEYRWLAEAFRNNLAAVLSTATIPFALASAGVHQSHLQRIHIAECIRALPEEDDPEGSGTDLDEIRSRDAHRIAHERMREFVESKEGQQVIIRDICNFLLGSLRHGLQAAAHELLQQGLVLLWSAFEVLFRDTFEFHLNRNPGSTRALVAHPTTRKRFEAEKLSLETLVEHGFDLSERIGTVLVAKQDFSDLPTLKSVYGVLFPRSTELHQGLADRNLWLLSQRRHLIVHRRGVVDQSYLDSTGEALPLGSRLSIAPDRFERDMKLVVEGGGVLLECLKGHEDSF